MDIFLHILAFLFGLALVARTLFSAISTFVLPRIARSQLNRVVFGMLRRVVGVLLHFTSTFEQRDAIMAYYAPIGLMLLVPAWYILITIGYAAMYWALGMQDLLFDLRLSGSSLLTLGFASTDGFLISILVFSEATIGLVLVALLIAYLPTMYSAFSRREQAVNLLEVRAGNPPSAVEMILRFNRIHGIERLNDYWSVWEAWFADVEESHTVLPALVFFRSPRPQNSWVVAAGAVLDAASLTLSAVDIPISASAQLSIRAGFLALRRITDYFDIPYPLDPHFPQDPISVTRAEFDAALDRLAQNNVPLKPDRDRAWADFAGWRVNYDFVLLTMCSLTMAPPAPWTGDRSPKPKLPPLFLPKKKL
jgi:ABC-type multidrug transport system fused ATPase/permease subunit